MTDEGELLRNQLARLIEEERFGWVGNPETLTPGMTIATSESLADKILARFDVRLREPQAEETLTLNRDEALYVVSWATAALDAFPRGFADVDHALLARIREFWGG